MGRLATLGGPQPPNGPVSSRGWRAVLSSERGSRTGGVGMRSRSTSLEKLETKSSWLITAVFGGVRFSY